MKAEATGVTALGKSNDAPFRPIRIMEVELGAAIGPIEIEAVSPCQPFERAHVLVLLAGIPVGIAWLEVPPAGLSGGMVADEIWRQLAPAITRAARRQGLRSPRRLTETGIAIPASRNAGDGNAVAGATFVSVIIATHDRPGALWACLDSIQASDHPAFEIIVVDNCPSSDATRALVQFRRDEHPVVYVREDRKGLAAAHNCGLAAARGEVVAFTDDDVVVDRSWLSRVVAGFASAPDIACVTGMILPRELETRAQLQLEAYMGYSKGMDPVRFDLGSHRPRSPTFPYTIGRVGSGANMAYRADVLRALGGFDPALGAGTVARGADDLDGFFAVITAGYGVLYQPSAYVHHQHHREIAAVRRQVYGCGVGYGAFLAKIVAERPFRLAAILLRGPLGLARPMALRGSSIAAEWARLPRSLVLYEYAGLFVGPFAYMVSRWRGRHWSRRAADRTAAEPRSEVGTGQRDVTRSAD